MEERTNTKKVITKKTGQATISKRSNVNQNKQICKACWTLTWSTYGT
jgi:hypothetical protein